MKKSWSFFGLLFGAPVLALVVVLGWWVGRTRLPEDANDGTRRVRADLRGGFKTILDIFKVDCGRYPTTEEGLNALINRPATIPVEKWHGPYFDPPTVPKDPWGCDFVYRCPGIHNTDGYDLYSCGPDGVSKTGGGDPDDITNWDTSSPRGGTFLDSNYSDDQFAPFPGSREGNWRAVQNIPLLGAWRI